MKSKAQFTNTKDYWNSRYLRNGNSGSGSYGKSAEFKASIINEFIEKNKINSVIEFGCGDGNQLSYSNYNQYLGVDISLEAVNFCKNKFKDDFTKKFITLEEYKHQTAELILSLDVIYHLIESETYLNYISMISKSCEKFLIVFSSNKNESADANHVKHRKFTDNLPSYFKLIKTVANPLYNEKKNKNKNFANFYIFERQTL